MANTKSQEFTPLSNFPVHLIQVINNAITLFKCISTRIFNNTDHLDPSKIFNGLIKLFNRYHHKITCEISTEIMYQFNLQIFQVRNRCR